MDKDEIIEMAEKAGFTLPEGETWYEAFPQCIEAFAKLVEDAAFKRWAAQTKLAVQDEREAIIDLVAMYGGPVDLEAAIRARS
jgi:hypothetical protein